MSRIAVLGGGVAGVTTASQLARRTGAKVDLIESEPHLGGLLRSVTIEGLVFDIGVFLFIQSNEFLAEFPSLLRDFKCVNPSLMRVAPNGLVEQYPFSIKEYIRTNGIVQIACALSDRFISRVRFRNYNNTGEWIKCHLGDSLYKNLGLKNYVERIYDVSDREIGTEFATQCLEYTKRFTLPYLITSTLRKTLSSQDTTAVPFLVRPTSGFQRVFDEVRRQLETVGVTILAPAVVKAVHQQHNTITLDVDGRCRDYDTVVSTIPIPVLLSLLGKHSNATYDHMNLVSLFYRGELKYSGDVLFNFSRLGKWRRLLSFSRLYDLPTRQAYFTVEITTKGILIPDITALSKDFERHMYDLGLMHNLEFLGSTTTPNAYPVFKVGEAKNVEKDKQLLSALGIHLAGRQGCFDYISSHDAAKQAKKAVAEIE